MTFDPHKPYTCDTSVKDEQRESHESYGLLSIHRTQGGSGKLFGSHLENQYQHFTLEIRQAEVIHNLSRDWYHPRAQLIEIHLTAAQFAEAITNLNMGGGIPCTISRVLGDQMEPPPQMTDTESKKIRTSFRESLKGLATSLLQKSKKVDELLEKKSLTIADKNEIRGVLHSALMAVKDNLPFVLDSFQESTEKVMTQAKAEMDAFVSMGLHRLGIESLQNRLETGENPMRVLGSKLDDE